MVDSYLSGAQSNRKSKLIFYINWNNKNEWKSRHSW